MKKALFIATVLRGHLLAFHPPFMELLQKRGYEVHVCSRNDTGAPCDIPNCDVYHPIPFERSPLSRENIAAYRELKRVIDAEGFDIIHCHTPVGGMLGRLAARGARENGAKVLYTAHGFHFYKGGGIKSRLIYYPGERWLARYTDVLITINYEDYESARRFPAKRVEYVPGVGVDITRFARYDPAGEPLYSKSRAALCEKRAALGLSGDDAVIITVGEFIPRKNHETLLRAFSMLKSGKTALLLCGVGRLENEMKELAKSLGISERVRFLGFRDDVPALLALSDVFVFPSHQEGLPVSLMEAMASGLPCVVSRVRGNRDLIKQGEGGYLRDARDAKGFAEDIGALLSSPEKRREMGDINREAVKAYALPEILRRMDEIYASVEGDG